MVVIIRKVSEEETCEQEWKGTGYVGIWKQHLLLISEQECTALRLEGVGNVYRNKEEWDWKLASKGCSVRNLCCQGNQRSDNKRYFFPEYEPFVCKMHCRLFFYFVFCLWLCFWTIVLLHRSIPFLSSQA